MTMKQTPEDINKINLSNIMFNEKKKNLQNLKKNKRVGKIKDKGNLQNITNRMIPNWYNT